MSAAISSSDRYEAARGALDGFEDETLESQASHAWNLADALRALIEPAAVNESVEEVAERVLRGTVPPTIDEDGDWCWQPDDLLDMLHRAVDAGIQAAWVSWEPDDYAPEQCANCGGDL